MFKNNKNIKTLQSINIIKTIVYGSNLFAFQLFGENTGAHSQTADDFFSFIYGDNENVLMTKCKNIK